jgi:hypothetical protein
LERNELRSTRANFIIARKTKTIKKLTKTALNVGRETVCTANVSPKKGYRAARPCKKQRIKGCAKGGG